MKKYLFTVLILLDLFYLVENVKGQMVYMPDSMLRLKLIYLGYGSCISNDSIDSACPSVQNADSMNLYYSGISDLQGIEVFISLTYLNCSVNNLTTLPALTVLLTNLNCSSNLIDSLPALPSSLLELNCASNVLTFLPNLPASLITLDCNFNPIHLLPNLPNSLLRLNCSNNQISSLPALTASLTELDCSMNLISTLPILPNSLSKLYCSHNQLTVLPSLNPLLTELDCSFNQLTSLPTLPGLLTQLNCSSNQLTTLPILPSFLVTLIGYSNYLNYLPSLPSLLEHLSCSGNQLYTLPTLPSTLNYLECMENHLTSLPLLPSTLVNLYCSNNQLISLPPVPNKMHNLYINDNILLMCLPELDSIDYLDFRNCPIVCVPDYGNVATSTPALNTLPLCGIFNSNSCDFYMNISGKIYFDSDYNCLQSLIEPDLSNVHLKLNENGLLLQQTFTNEYGRFAFDVNNFGNYEILVDTINIPFTVLCPSVLNYLDTINGTDSLIYNNDFALKCKSGFDVGAWSIVSTPFGPGRHSVIEISAGDVANYYGMHCANSVSGSLIVTINGSTNYSGPVAGALTPSIINGNIITYNIADFGTINSNADFVFEVETDTIATSGSSICIDVTLTPTSGDNNISNNILTNCFTVMASFDPNDKQVYPAGIIDTSLHWLTYTIRFQNTGNAPADNIYILDTLSDNINLATFQLLATSHPSYVQILDGGIAKFNFPNINLPDSFNNEPLSHGYIQYKVKLKDNLPIGTQIENTAYIYFDFNVPVMTNTTSNTIDLSNGISKQLRDHQINVYPVPFENNFMIQTNTLISSQYSIVNLFGAEIVKGKMISSQKINSESWLPGVYFLRVENERGVVVRKLIKE